MKEQVKELETHSVNLEEIDTIVDEIGNRKQDVIPILQAIQKKYHYLPAEALERVCHITDISPEAITGVSTFYSQFRHRPAGRHMVKVCVGTACHVKGADTLVETLLRHLDIPEGSDTDSEGNFTVEKVGCLGCCMIAPVVQVDEDVFGFVETKKVPHLVKDALKEKPVLSETEVVGVSRDAIGEVRVCLCSSCVAGGSNEVFSAIRKQVSLLKLPVQLKQVGCSGQSFVTPLVEVALYNDECFKYGMVRPDEVQTILLKHFRPAGFFKRMQAAAFRLMGHMLTDESWDPPIRFSPNVRHQDDSSMRRIVTEHAGVMDPEEIQAYIDHEGFVAMKEALFELDADEILNEVLESRLRGRGGAGFSTGLKWQFTRQAKGDLKYIICNGDEGDPGAFMDRMILESFPFRVIEGMVIAARAVGAHEGYFYIRAEYPLAMKRIQNAIKLCLEFGYLGEDIMGSGFDFTVHVTAGAGAFVCGEETALMAAIEGGRGMPRYRPPYPAESGLWGKPTLINNVETLGLIPWIIREGAEAFSAIGTEKSCGTKTFALAGKIRRGGLVEVPMGKTILEIVEETGGGVPDGKKLKAVLVGGPSGGCVPSHLCSTPVDYEELTNIGSMMGSGGMVVLDETDCMVDIARYLMEFLKDESCGKCVPCRVGTMRMYEILERLCSGKGAKSDLSKLKDLAKITKVGSLCGLGVTAPNPLVSSMKWFPEEYEAHINGICPAGKCKDLITYRINDLCIGCTRCAQYCPTDAIPADPYHIHEIFSDQCIRCDICRQVCPTEAVEVVSA